MRSWSCSAALLLCSLTLGSGCATRLGLYDVSVALDQSLIDAHGHCEAVEVHLVALDPFQCENMARRSMTDYWRPGRRPDAYEAMKFHLYFGEDKDQIQRLSHTNALWQAWDQDGTKRLWVLADIPGVHQDAADDPRRLVVPLIRTRRWFRDQHTIDIGVSREGLYCVQPGMPAPVDAHGTRKDGQP